MNDARIHACIVCASVSCPNLQATAYGMADHAWSPRSLARNLSHIGLCLCLAHTTTAVGSLIESQKNDSMQSFLANTMKGSLLDVGRATLTLSAIFDWYQSDFATLQFPTLNGGQVRAPTKQPSRCAIITRIRFDRISTREIFGSFSSIVRYLCDQFIDLACQLIDSACQFIDARPINRSGAPIYRYSTN